MTALIVLVVIFIVLSLSMYMSKRRYGIPALALAAGYVMSAWWVGDLTPLVARSGIQIIHPPLESVIAFTALLVPAFLVMLGGAKADGKWARIIGSVLFAVMAIGLLDDVLQASLVINGPAVAVFAAISHYKIMIVSLGLLLAIGDVMAIKLPRGHARH